MEIKNKKRQKERETKRQRETERQRGRQAEKERDRETERQIHFLIDVQKDERQTDRQN